MPPVTTQDSGILSLLSNRISLPASVQRLAEQYQAAKPYPHVVLDGMFDDQMLDRLVSETPALNNEKWVENKDEHLTKYNLRSAVELADTGFQHVAFVHSAAFLYLLSEITGIWELLPDPYLQGGGYHILPSGAKFDVHADRNTAYQTGLARRLGMITYLNRDWKHEYGGQLELWDKAGTRCEVVVEPVFNRTILFEIANKNFHGVPSPIAAPGGRARNSFVVYYHTTQGKEKVAPHSSVYAPSFYQKKGRTFGQIVRDCTPPIIVRNFQKIFPPKY